MENKNGINEEVKKGFALVGGVNSTKININDMKNQKRKMKESMTEMVGLSEDIITSIIEKIGDRDISKLTNSDIEELFTIDGKFIELDKVIEDKKYEFLKDFASYCKSMMENEKNIDKCISDMEKEIESTNEEYDAIMRAHGSMYSLMASNIEQLSKSENGEVAKVLLEVFDDVITLKPVFEYLNVVSPKNVLYDYANNDAIVYNKYKSLMKKYEIRTDLVKVRNLGLLVNSDCGENEKEICILSNIVTFILIRYYGSKSNFSKLTDLGFITAYTLFYGGLIENKLDKELVARFKESYDKIISIFIPLIK